MAKILVNDDWYETIDPGVLYESEFEKILMSKSHVVFPEYYALPFKKTVSNEYDSARADYALIHKEYYEWWIIEVEMAHHPLKGHVIPQIHTLSTAYYGPDEALYLVQKNPNLNLKQLKNMMKGSPPKVLVVLDRHKPDWQPSLDAHGAKLAIFEIFKSSFDRYVYRVNGFFPSPEREKLSLCQLDPAMPMLLQVFSPASLEMQTNDLVEIVFQDRITMWSRIDSKDKVWLKQEKRNPLKAKKIYRLLKSYEEKLKLEEVEKF